MNAKTIKACDVLHLIIKQLSLLGHPDFTKIRNFSFRKKIFPNHKIISFESNQYVFQKGLDGGVSFVAVIISKRDLHRDVIVKRHYSMPRYQQAWQGWACNLEDKGKVGIGRVERAVIERKAKLTQEPPTCVVT